MIRRRLPRDQAADGTITLRRRSRVHQVTVDDRRVRPGRDVGEGPRRDQLGTRSSVTANGSSRTATPGELLPGGPAQQHDPVVQDAPRAGTRPATACAALAEAPEPPPVCPGGTVRVGDPIPSSVMNSMTLTLMAMSLLDWSLCTSPPAIRIAANSIAFEENRRAVRTPRTPPDRSNTTSWVPAARHGEDLERCADGGRRSGALACNRLAKPPACTARRAA